MSAFSLHSNFSEEELPTYQEIEQSPDVVVEEREIIPSDDEDDDYEEEERATISVQTTTTTTTTTTAKFAPFKSIFSGNVQKHNARLVLEQSVISIPEKSGLSDRRPLAKFLSIQTKTQKKRPSLPRMSLRLNNA